jgi:hypothetical protein
MARTITCDGCGRSVTLYGTEDPHAALVCDCCPEDHHHGQATATTGIPCRPVTHRYEGEFAAPGTAG